jgi:hypothetical protein
MAYQDSSNLYAFAAGDPVNGRDPLGLASKKKPDPVGQVLSSMIDTLIKQPVESIGPAMKAASEFANDWLSAAFTGNPKAIKRFTKKATAISMAPTNVAINASNRIVQTARVLSHPIRTADDLSNALSAEEAQQIVAKATGPTAAIAAIFTGIGEGEGTLAGASRSPAVIESDDYVTLYHGTDAEGAANIRAKGIDLSYSRQRTDFGRGFYVTEDRAQAVQWAGTDGEVLAFRVPRSGLARLNGLTFADASSEWEAFVRSNRTGASLHGYDYVEGPMLGNPRAFMGGGPARAFGHQLSAHTPTLIELLMRGLQ